MTPASCVSSVTAACVRRRRHATYATARVLPAYALHGYGMYAIERLSDGAWLGNAGLVRRDGLPGPDIGYAVLSEFARGKAMPVRRRGRCLPMRVASWACAICMASPTWTTWCPERSCWAWACRSAGVVQLPGVDSPSRLYATPGAADVG